MRIGVVGIVYGYGQWKYYIIVCGEDFVLDCKFLSVVQI